MHRPILATLFALLVTAPVTPAAWAQATKAPTKAPVTTSAKPVAKAPALPALRARQPQTAAALSGDLRSLISTSTRTGTWGVMVVSLTNGDTLYGHNSDELLLPASTMKLYTSAVALERFGPAHTFRTEILRDGTLLANGTIDGDLIFVGAGDPSLSPRYAEWNDGVKPMDAIANLVVKAGITRVRGDIVADASAFDDSRVPDGWRVRNLQAGYSARVSALSSNGNLAVVEVSPGDRGARVGFVQPVSGVSIVSSVTVRPNVRGASVRVWQDTIAQVFRVNGWIGSLSPSRSYQVVVEQPERFTAAAFRAALEARGIVVDGRVRVGQAPASAQKVTAWASPPLAQLVATMNGESNNHFAELIFRNAARTDGNVGSAAVANESLRTFLSDRVGVSPDAVFAADGSGLSTLDRVTPRSMVALLGYTAMAPWGAVLQASLPVAGRTETLRTRMRATAAQGNLRGKTGTTNEVTSLGGYVTAKNGEELAFAFIYNGRELWRARDAIDAMGATLASFTR